MTPPARLPSAAAPTGRRLWLGLLGFLLLCYGFQAASYLLNGPAGDAWYAALRKPVFNPPDAVFAVVWATLALLMALAGWVIWRQNGISGARWPLALFTGQMVLNVAWTVLFFRFQSVVGAMVALCLLWAAVTALTLLFWRVQRSAGGLLAPYWAWLTFAVVLNVSYLRLNP